MDRDEKAFEFAAETAKQLLTLATGILALSVAFLKDVASGGGDWARWFLVASWIMFALSAVSGVGVLMSLVANLQPKPTLHGGDPNPESPRPSVWAKPVVACAAAQWVLFALGLALAIVFAVLATSRV